VLDIEVGKKKIGNARVIERVLQPNDARWMNQILQYVVRGGGTGRRAAVPGRVIAGKTGTTDTYADAWFVGYTPELVVAVWVGYPESPRPMETEYDGDPVAGGTFPADIFRTFMESALPRFDGPRYFPVARDDGAVETRVINRDNRWYRDNGRCQNTRVISFVPGRAPAAVAPCKANEVTVPDVIGMKADEASRLLRAQPLLPDVFRKAASPGEQIGVVVDLDPDPAKALSAYDTVKIWVTVAPKGTVPNVVGLPLLEAREKLTNRRLLTAVDGVEDLDAIVVEQSPRGNVAAGEGMTVALKLARGEPDAGRSPRG
jgi:membrane peptidoglycan carboxypeptidase